ncbi:hypothetical protein MMC11_002443 [Xylographa trunciseda]|nr:hypothetical protein [Xylographa trunciseda]
MGQPSYIPRRPSPLHISCSPPSPSSPIGPTSPFDVLPPQPFTLSLISPLPQLSRPPPTIPPLWTWSCHRCSEHYPIGATRRCLHDGHYFCSGNTIDKKGHTKKHKACGSLFDYVGWKAWGEWRRDSSSRKRRRGPKILREEGCGCGTECDFPSQCRWKPRLSTARLAAVTSIVEEDLSPISPASPTSSNGSSPPRSPTSPSSPPLSPRENLDRVLQSVQRRKSGSHGPIKHDGSSVLSSIDLPALSFSDFKTQMDNAHNTMAGEPVSLLDIEEEDGDIEMADVDLADMGVLEHEVKRGGATSNPFFLDYDYEDVADSLESLDTIDNRKPFRDLGTIEGREIVVEVLPDLPLSPRRNAWDWSVGGFGSNVGSMDGFMDLDTWVDV